MAKVVVFDIGNGSFEEGFPVTLSINEEGKPTHFVQKGKLPPAPEIPELYWNFQKIYRNLPLLQRIIVVDSSQRTNFSTPLECRNAADLLEESLKTWYSHNNMIQLRQWVQEEVNVGEPARIIFQTDNELLKKLPLHQWELFHNRPCSWIALGGSTTRPSTQLVSPVKILTILGNTEGLDTDIDTYLLDQLPEAEVTKLRQPTRKILCDTLRNKGQPYDILYFAGHSFTREGGNDGVIQISDIDSLPLGELRNAFKKAIENGLKLAIFNSCDGLGLANRLATLKIPQVIVMREPVPDEVAHEFLQEFLLLFSQGEQFYTAVRQAQESLEGIEGDYPCASWLPVICQNPAENSLLWPQPLPPVSPSKYQQFTQKLLLLWRRYRLAILAIITLVLVVLVGFLTHKDSSHQQTSSDPSPAPSVTAAPLPPTTSFDKYFSQGENPIFNIFNNKENSNEKTNGINAFKSKDWDSAIQLFTNSLKQNRNDPEALIYLNNAIARKSGRYLSIAVAVPISANPNSAEEVLRGVAHAQSEFNCNGVDSIKSAIDNNQTPICTGNIKGKSLLVEIVNENDKKDNSPFYEDTVVEVAKEIVKRDYLAVIGHNGSKNTILAVKNAYQNNLAVISPTSSSNDFDTLQYLVYRTAPSDSSTAKLLYDYVNSKLAQSAIKVVVAYDHDDPYSNSLKEAFKSYLPQKEYDFESDMFQSNFNPTIVTDKARNANVLLLIPSTKEHILNKALEVVQKVSETTDLKPILLSADTMAKPTTTQKFGEAAQNSNLVLAIPWHRSDGGFENEANKLWPYFQISWRTAMAYDAMKTIIQGLKYIPDSPNQITRENLKTELSKMSKNVNIATGADAPVRFTDKGSRQEVGVLVKVKCKTQGESPVCNFEKLR